MTQQTISEEVVFITAPKIEVHTLADPPHLVGKSYVWRHGHYVDSDGSNRPFYLQKNGLWSTRNDNGHFDAEWQARQAVERSSSKASRRTWR